MLIRDLMINGFVVYPKDDKFILEKISVPSFMKFITPQPFDTFEQALEFASEILQKHLSGVKQFNVIVRYDRGLGIEFKNLPNIDAKTIEEAQIVAQKHAEETLKGYIIHEIRIRPRN